MAHSQNKSEYFPYIDGLRAIAVLSVIVYHLKASWLPGGFSGVDMFFVISGFVVMGSVSWREKQTFPGFLAFFYARRLQRIAPALIVCLLVTSIASALFIPNAWLSDVNQRVGLMAFFGLSNFALLYNGGDYFAPRAEYIPYTHTWSLGVEEQFYVIFPFLFFAWMLSIRGKRISLILFALALACSVIYAAWISSIDPNKAFYMITSRFWQLASGVVLYQLFALRKTRDAGVAIRRPRQSVAMAGALISLIVLAVGLWFIGEGMSPWPGGILPVVGTLGVIGFLYHRTDNPIAVLLSSRGMVAIGRISYSLYLWHWPVFVLFRWTVGMESFVTGSAALALTFLFAILSYQFVEKPLRYASWLRALPRPAVVSIALTTIGVFALGHHWVGKKQPNISLSTVVQNSSDWYPHGVGTDARFPGCSVAARYEDLGGAGVYLLRREGCDSDSDTPRLFAIGDSHTGAFMTMFHQTALATGSEVSIYTNGGCPFISLAGNQEYKDPRCNGYAVLSLEDILSKARHDDVLFLASLRLPRLVEQDAARDAVAIWEAMFGEQAIAWRKEGEAHAIDVLKPFRERGMHIVFEAPLPLLRAPPFRCSDWFNRDNPLCRQSLTVSRDYLQQLRAPVLESYSRIIAALPGTVTWDPFPVLCPPGKTCNGMHDGKPLLFDGDHLSGYGNRVLAPDFFEFLHTIEPAFRVSPISHPIE
ncbi:MAG: acyltransferase [Xanthomonadaceae bacterium]|nr:acyltransferase [Xanthomonadaceae bacterium]